MDGDSVNDQPFHEGERRLQSRAGVQEKMERIGGRLIHNQLPAGHCAFYEQQAFVLVGHVDAAGRPWASVLPGVPGFIRCLDAHTLRMVARPLPGDPLAHGLQPDAHLGLLGIDLNTRQRSRVSARIAAVAGDRFALSVVQAYGNCPRYIQRRQLQKAAPTGLREVVIQSVHRIEGRAREMIAAADTFFVASHSGEAGGPASRGADVSHRGGRAGFVRIDDGRVLTVPDYAGNGFFNTLGNFMVNPRAGLLFIDFSTGDVLMLTGGVEVLDDPALAAQIKGAERIWRFNLGHGQLLRHALPLRWNFLEYSPHSLRAGAWDQAASRSLE